MTSTDSASTGDAVIDGLIRQCLLTTARASQEPYLSPESAYDWGASEARAALISAIAKVVGECEQLARIVHTMDHLDALLNTVDALRSQLERAKGWLQHTPRCDQYNYGNIGHPCTCGLQAFLESLGPTASVPDSSPGTADSSR
jgi:hypothetical protein